MEMTLIESARATFGITALYHFLFVPLTIGLAATAALLQSVAILKKDQQLWSFAGIFGPIFLINFVCGMVTGYPLRALIVDEWSSYYALVKDVFASVFEFEDALLPVNLILVLLYVFGRKRLPQLLHTFVTAALTVCLMAQGSAILAINCYMQYPYGVEWENGAAKVVGGMVSLFKNPMWLMKMLHQMAAALTMGATFVMAVASVFLIVGKQMEASEKTLKLSGLFGICSLLVTMWFGHESAMTVLRYQPMKFAVMEALWDVEPGSEEKFAFVLLANPDKNAMRNRNAIEIPGMLSFLTGEESRIITGISQQKEQNRRKISESSRKGETLGYASLLGNTSRPSAEDIDAAALRTIPNVPLVFWSFRIMIVCGLMLMVVMIAATRYRPDMPKAGRMILWACLFACPLPWISIEAGWIVAEAGRQPWLVTGIVSTSKGASSELAHLYAQKSYLPAVLVAVSILGANFGLTALHLRRAVRQRAGHSVLEAAVVANP